MPGPSCRTIRNRVWPPIGGMARGLRPAAIRHLVERCGRRARRGLCGRRCPRAITGDARRYRRGMAWQGRVGLSIRRDFLKGASGGVAGLLAARSAAAQTPPRPLPHPPRARRARRSGCWSSATPSSLPWTRSRNEFTAQTGINIEYGEPGLRPAQRAVGNKFRQRHPGRRRGHRRPDVDRSVQRQRLDHPAGRLHQPRRGHQHPGFHPGGALLAQHLARPDGDAPHRRLRAGGRLPAGCLRGEFDRGASDRRGQRGRLDLGSLPGDRREPARHRLRGNEPLRHRRLRGAAGADRPHVHPTCRQLRRPLVPELSQRRRGTSPRPSTRRRTSRRWRFTSRSTSFRHPRRSTTSGSTPAPASPRATSGCSTGGRPTST